LARPAGLFHQDGTDGRANAEREQHADPAARAGLPAGQRASSAMRVTKVPVT